MSENINRAFMYGESVFTTMRMINGALCDWEYHFERLKNGIEFVYGSFTEGDDWAFILRNRLEERCLEESGDRVIRLAVYLDQDRGLIRAAQTSVNKLKIAVYSSAYDTHRSDAKMFKLRTCASPIRPNWWPSFLKAGNYLETILSQRMNMRHDDDDILFLSSLDTVLESSVANIFVVKHNRLYTAPLGPSVLAGVMRQKVLEVSEEFFDESFESASTVEQLLKADAVFGTNSVRGPFLIDRIDDHEISYSTDFLRHFENLRKRVYG